MSSALVEFVVRFRERERENARQPLTLEIAQGVRVAVVARDRTPRQLPPLQRRSTAMRV
jgi:hypothetical protein